MGRRRTLGRQRPFPLAERPLRIESLESRLPLSAVPYLVADVNAQQNDFPYEPTELINVKGTLYFATGETVLNSELWKSDGTAAGTVQVRDINPGPAGSGPHELTEANGLVYFFAYDEPHGFELWRSDGTESGSYRLSDCYENPFPRSKLVLRNVAGVLYFVANDGTHGYELWKSDGTVEGTVMVRDIKTGPDWSMFFGKYEPSPPFADADGVRCLAISGQLNTLIRCGV